MRERGFEIVSEEEFGKGHGSFSELSCTLAYDNIRLPSRATSKSAGYDFYSPFSFTLAPEEEIHIPLGIKAYMLSDEVLMVYPRSGHGFKYYVRLANSVGVIDSDYYGNAKNEGHIQLKIRNETKRSGITLRDNHNTLNVNIGDAVCQGIFTKYLLADGDTLNNGEVRQGGFGSTG